jgi:hypothetical protein
MNREPQPSSFRETYESAFKRFARAVSLLEELAKAPARDRALVDAAMIEVEKARIAYNHARDTLAAAFLPADHGTGMHASPADLRVRRLARLRWELNGRPSGTAEDDWAQAEELVRSSTA